MAEDNLYFSLGDLEGAPKRVLIVGSGPAGVAVAEYLYSTSPEEVTIGILERGQILTTTHVNNLLRGDPSQVTSPNAGAPPDMRAEFIKAHGQFLWEGDFKSGGMMITALGGRGIVAGAHLRRFYKPDFSIWDHGLWPIGASVLAPYYTRAEMIRHVSYGESEGVAQTWALGQLAHFFALPPPWGLDIRSNKNKDISRGYDSSVSRLWALVHYDYMAAKVKGKSRRLFVSPQTYVTQIEHNGRRVEGLICKDASDVSSGAVKLNADFFVLAANPIESARLFLNSGLAEDKPAAGRYLAEHIYCRGLLSVPAPSIDPREQFVNVIIPPQGDRVGERFHINVQGDPDLANLGNILFRITGCVAMEPSPENRVAIKSSTNDDHGVPKAHVTLSYSNNDKFRIDATQNMMHNIAKALGGRFDKDPDTIEKGRSHHEAGTLRMGHADDERSVTNADGQVHGIDNLYVADAALFPCVGVANPMLTVTALGYRLADHIAARLRGASMPQRLRSQAARAVGSQKQAARERFERHFDEVDLGHATGVDNEQIDADLAREYADTHEEQ